MTADSETPCPAHAGRSAMMLTTPSRLSDCELIEEVTRLAGCEREATVELITHLAELDKRRLYLGAGFSSLFTYCTEALRLSEHAAFHRILAARKARRFPGIIRMYHLHGERGDAPEAAAGPGPAAPCRPERRPCRDHRPGLDGASRGGGAPEVRGHRSPACEPPRGEFVPPSARRGQARGVGPGPWPLRLRERGRPPLQRAGLRRVPPREALRRRWSANGGQHRASMPLMPRAA